MELYLDVIILENFIVNLFLIITTFKILKYNYSFKRAILVAVIGGVYSLCMVIEEISFLKAFYIQLLIAFIMVYIPSVKREKISLIKSFSTFIGASFFLSGLIFKIILSSQKYTIIDGVVIKNLNVKFLMLGVFVLFIVLERIMTVIKDRNIISSFIYDIELNIKDKKINIKGFLDSGNELREPITNLPCILIEKAELREISLVKGQMYKIPYRAIGYSGGIYGFKVKNIKISKDGKVWRELEGIICPCDDKLSRENQFVGLISRGVI
ncbi:sigma-E processing peptidase SpoIIGA [uncultured Clostridium sp.]|uniref:sigma-E processing peptidase SpoIIGA n=1 Tax=uncultured Clostridium sp. TaxID=59620 RepID=UPI0026317B57|nr:sigma-E processing peptidase SpoIIGA [uncultured Clostridium sp.]